MLYLAPRFSFKTSLLICFIAYLILKWREMGRDIAIDYIRSDYELASEVLYELKQNLETQEFILELWGDLSKAAKLWAENKINLGTRRDPTVNVSGLNRGTAGKHPDVVIADDMVNEKNFESIKAKRQAKNKVQAYSPVLPPWGSMIVCGTRFAHNDVYGWIIETNDKDARLHKRLMEEAVAIVDDAKRKLKLKEAAACRPQWTSYIRSVRDAKGNLFFPDKLTDEFLAQQQRSIEPKFFAAWYLNRPDVEGMVRFRLEYLRYFSARYARWPVPTLEILADDGRTLEEKPVRVTMTIDPTLTANGTSDWTGVTVVATDADGVWWVLLAGRFLEVPSVVGEKCVEIIRRFQPSVVQIESAMADVEMVSRIQRAILEERLPSVISSYNPLVNESGGGVGRPGRRKKAARIEALEPRFRNGLIYLHRATCEPLYDQYKNWPDLDHDDVFDALAMQWALAKPCSFKTVEEATSVVLDETDEEPGAWTGGSYRMVPTGRDGRPILGPDGLPLTLHVPVGGDDEPDRLLGRSGRGAQRLRTA